MQLMRVRKLVQQVARRGNAGLKSESAIYDLGNVTRDELGHLEHAHLALAVKYGPERVVGIDLRPDFFILKTVLLDVVPKLFGELGTWNRFRTNNGGEFVVGLHWSHEGGIRLAFGRSLFGCRHRG
jgi:hypothetical protein